MDQLGVNKTEKYCYYFYFFYFFFFIVININNVNYLITIKKNVFQITCHGYEWKWQICMNIIIAILLLLLKSSWNNTVTHTGQRFQCVEFWISNVYDIYICFFSFGLSNGQLTNWLSKQHALLSNNNNNK